MAFVELLNLLTLRTALLGLAVFALVAWLVRRPANLPPGPTGWPLLGYLPQLVRRGDEYRTFTELARTHGDVFSLNLCGQLMVVLNSYEAVKKALALPSTADRPPSTFYNDATPDPKALGKTMVSAYTLLII